MGSGGPTGWRWRSSKRLIPPHGQPDRRPDEPDQEAVPVAAAEQGLEQGAGLVALADRGERVDVPEGAHQEGVVGFPEVVLLHIAEHKVAALELAPDGPHRAHEPRIVVGEEAELVQAKQARVQGVAVRGGHEAVFRAIPAALADELVDASRVGAPVSGALLEPQVRRDLGQPVASGPAHHAGEGVYARRAAQLPDAGVRLVVQCGGMIPEGLQTAKQHLVAATHQPAVEEHVGRRQNRRAVDVVLHLAVGLIADPDRTHAAIPGERIDLLLFTHRAPAEAVHGLQAAVVRTGDDIDDVAEVALHGPRGAEAVERVDHEVGVAQPAVPIVPVAATALRFGNRRRHRRDDRPGILADVELQRDGGADHRVLPFERDAERADPFPPIRRGLLEEAAPDLRDGPLHGLVRPEQQSDRVFQKEEVLLHQSGYGGVRRQPQHQIGARVSDMVRAAGDLRARTTIVIRGPKTHPYAGIAGRPFDLPHQHHRSEHAPVLAEARREIGDLDAPAAVVVQAGREDRCVDEIVLLGPDEVAQLDAAGSEIGVTSLPAQERAKRRIAGEPWEARPHDVARRIQESADRAVADQSEIEGCHRPRSSHARTACTSRRCHRAAVRPGPTLIEYPCRRLTVAKPYSSVTSSPTNTGVRPRNGSSRMNSSTATPLSLPAGFISTTRLPAWMQYRVPACVTKARASRWTKPPSRGARR